MISHEQLKSTMRAIHHDLKMGESREMDEKNDFNRFLIRDGPCASCLKAPQFNRLCVCLGFESPRSCVSKRRNARPLWLDMGIAG